ncbi:MAG: hypothetical protein HKO65_03820 [Gemmatimonadetes bacterium]|nr:hypothetical protein [Gemmatimonadota bacterium]NNM04207.1 hypothetical protein [Gemmatimonadota bacterium]
MRPNHGESLSGTEGNVTGIGSGTLPDSAPFGLVPPPDDERLRETVAALAEAGGESVETILLYGSHVQASSPDQWSAYDFLLVTDSYSKFFKRLVEKGHHKRPAWLLSALSRFLAPNIISFDMGRPDQPPAKCAVVSPRHLRRSLHPHSPDHFLKGRVVQKLALVWSRGPKEEETLLSAVRMARDGIVRWVRPFLPSPFTLDVFAEKMLRVSYRGEIRPEAPDRVFEVFQAQKETLEGIARESLEAAQRRGEVSAESGTYRWTREPGRGAWAFTTLYFITSKVRATTRWFKYMITFDGWLDYIQRKIERRAGFEVEIQERDRKWPLIFLWPKLFQVLRNLKDPEDPPAPKKETESA